MTKRLKNPAFWGHTYLCSSFKGVPPGVAKTRVAGQGQGSMVRVRVKSKGKGLRLRVKSKGKGSRLRVKSKGRGSSGEGQG